jgi:hypothetical protein
MEPTKKNMRTVSDPSNKVCLEVNVKETKHMLLSYHQNAGQNRLSENVAQMKHLQMTVTNTNLIQEEIKRTLIMGNAWVTVHNNYRDGITVYNIAISI